MGKYDKVYVNGKEINKRTANMLRCAENRLGYDLYVVQGSYNAGGVSASAGTHDGGGAVDVSVGSNPQEIVRALREVGFAAWHRTPDQGPWNAHIHAIAIGDAQMSSGAKSQVDDYLAGRNGLASHAPDDGPRLHPIPTWRIKFPRVRTAVVIKQSKAKKPISKVAVKRVQIALKGRGYYNGTADGVFGPVTKKAFSAFVDRRDLTVGVNRRNIKILCRGYYTVL